MRKLLLLVFVFIGFVLAAEAQQKVVTGTVTFSEDGMPIVGATVQIKGTLTGVATNLEGRYSIRVGVGEVLTFRYVGRREVEITVGADDVYDVEMEPDYLGLDEVIVIAYGTTRRETYTGSASVVRSETLSRSPTVSVSRALQASAPGVQVVNASGASGAEPVIRIRGVGSITADASPLWVVDGVVDAQVPNVNDIESITVLKDATSASLYGSRAANGVILVTTKRGQEGRTNFSYIAKQSYSTRTTNKFEMLNAAEFYQKSWEGIYNWATDQGMANPAQYAHDNIVPLAGRNPFDIAQPFDNQGNIRPEATLMLDQSWFDLAHRTGVTSEHTLTASGGEGNTNFYFSGTYFETEAITMPDEMQRVMGYMNISTRATDFITVGFTTTLNYQQGNTVKDITNGSGTGYAAYTYPNNVPLYELDENFEPVIGVDGRPLWNWSNLVSMDYNPVAQDEMDPRANRSTSLFSTFNVNVRPLDNLVFDSKVSGRFFNYHDEFFRNPYHGDGKAYGGSSDKFSEDMRRIMTSTTATYDFNVGSSNFSLLGGYETEYAITKDMLASGRGFDIPFSEELSLAAEPFNISSSTEERSMISYFSRLNYSAFDRYYISASFRRDGSSRFGPENRWANFWSASAAWRINQEDFLAGVGWINDLRLRASYGINGNQAVPPYAFLPVYTIGVNNYDYNVGMVASRLGNPRLRWERNEVLNVGVDFTLFRFLRGSVEFFDRNTVDLLQNMPIAPSTGFTSILSNVGGLNNRGVELELHTTNLDLPNFVWLTDFNISKYRNQITALSQDEIITAGAKRWAVGNSLYVWYMREYAGVDPDTGEAMWYMDIVDAEGDPTGERETTTDYSAATRYELGESLPTLYGGLTNSFIIHRNLNFSFQLYWSLGGKVYNSLMQQTMNDGSRYGHQLNKEVLNSWQEPGDDTDVPRFVYGNNTQSNATSSRFLEDGSYLRMRNVNLNYNLPVDWVRSVGLSSANVFVNADNLFVLTRYAGHDPEQGLGGTTNTTLVPNVRTFTFGLNVTF